MVDDLAWEKAMVRAGWEGVELLNRLGEGPSLRAHGLRWETDKAEAIRTISPLDLGDALTPGHRRGYESPANLTRFRRTLDFLVAGDRVFDVGLGRGYLAGVLLRDGALGAYRGVDIVRSNVTATSQVIDALGAGDRADVAVGNLYDLTRAQLERFGATMVICCEVIEHVPDAELAVRTLADALPMGAELLFSVPLLGRLEGMWGHVALFDTARVKSMAEDAGLVVHAVDVIANTWAFVLASHDRAPSARARAAAEVHAALPVEPETHDVPRTINNVEVAELAAVPGSWSKHLDSHTVRLEDGRIVCRFHTSGKTGPAGAVGTGTTAAGKAGTGQAYGGIRIPIERDDPVRGFRFELDVSPIEAVSAVFIDGYCGSERIARWKWDTARHPSASERPMTAVLREGRRGSRFLVEKLDDLTRCDAVEIFARVQPGTSARFVLSRAAFYR